MKHGRRVFVALPHRRSCAAGPKFDRSEDHRYRNGINFDDEGNNADILMLADSAISSRHCDE
jgi:hypothetical protein